MPNPMPQPAAGSEELRKNIDQIVMATINHGHQVITEQHSKEKSYVYVAGVGDKLVLTRFEAVDAIQQLITTQNDAMYAKVMEAIGSNEPELDDDEFTESLIGDQMNECELRGRNQLRAELCQSMSKIFGKAEPTAPSGADKK